MFSRVLVANRGEIACRIMATARRLGIATVAVYSEADRDALHVEVADEAHAIGPAPAADSYLNIDAIVDAARRSGAEAVHPGYGFLAENADFADAVVGAGLVFVGPPAGAIRAMASKSAARAIMARAGVPVVPGYHGRKQDAGTLRRAADRIGYPVIIKASAGGGGRGMRIVETPAALQDAAASARREARAAFGDGRLLVEKLLASPRHVEVQVFADSHGNAVHLFERDCSIQRRHQKVIEEAPAPDIPATLRRGMYEAALAAVNAIGYVGAGTVEFLVDAKHTFHFMEMNARIQVEHPVTEMITGTDLVEWQFVVAAGEPLPCRQADLAVDGCAIEARLYAEDPAHDFAPGSGRLVRFRPPDAMAANGGLRIETGLREDDDVTVHYDAMIAKVVAWGGTRASAIEGLRRALGEFQVAGVVTNLDFLRAICANNDFARGRIDTEFVERRQAELTGRPRADRETLALAGFAVVLWHARSLAAAAQRSSDPYSPWHASGGWRLNREGRRVVILEDNEDELVLAVRLCDGGVVLDLPSGPVNVAGDFEGEDTLAAVIDGTRVHASVLRHGDMISVMRSGVTHTLRICGRAQPLGTQGTPKGDLTAPMPGRVVAIHAKPGAQVAMGAPLVVIEAMKMEHAISAPRDGVVAGIHFVPGDQVEEGAVLLSFEEEATDS